ncbi:hypothetical protein JXB22_01095 [candidate division WOR-3 bacterium]|nr:hypothetical protein [candidate division WOR-3 bacterium]
MQYKDTVSIIILVAVALLQTAFPSVQADAVYIVDTEQGSFLEYGKGMNDLHEWRSAVDASVLWSRYLTDAIFQTTSNTIDGYVFTGTYLNPPKEVGLYTPAGGGTPEWTYNGEKFYTDAGDAAFTLVGADQAALGLNVTKWTGPDSIPDWTASFPSYIMSSYGPIAVSDDGSTIAIIAAPSGTDAHLLLFNADSSMPLIDYVATGQGFPRCVKICADGRYTAFIALSTLVVFDRDSLAVRAQIPMGFTNSAMDISGDGNVLAYGWPILHVMEWTGTAYQDIWTWSPGGHYVSRIAISNDGSTIVSCWYTGSHNTIKVAVHTISSPTPLWVYDYPISSGVYQESAADVDITNNGAYFIIGSWGDAANLNPEVHILQRDTLPHVYYTVDMPGSVFSVDMSNDGTYATACGKHIHANVSGRGGDIVEIGTDIVGKKEAASVSCDHQFSGPTIFSGPLVFGSDKSCRIYDTSGREIHTIDPVPGIYFIEIDHTIREKIIKIR